jgi:lipopolysaccharide transport system ATP-binding protein
MSASIISARGISKQYRLGAVRKHDTLRDQITHAASSLFTRSKQKDEAARAEQTFWALQEVSFDVQPGEVVGIIGRNGAGKSTLLKILSQITEPTAGEIHVRGRLASLLEVGTGFHPELSGRENIFLNGAILGMTRAEIRRKFDEIVAFAEIEKFLDTPVKRYSSGMYVRLAFAVAAHLEPEILVVDEVLAVGDASFQNKCLGKMEEVAKSRGRTVLFVSHNMSAVQVLCGRVLHLKGGRVAGVGTVEEMVRAYLEEVKGPGAQAGGAAVGIGKSLELRRLAFAPNPVASGSDVEFSLEIAANRDTRVNALVLLFYSVYGVRVAIVDLRQVSTRPLRAQQTLAVRGCIRELPFIEGDYRVGLCAASDESYGDYFDLATLTVTHGAEQGGVVPFPVAHRGLVELGFSAEAGT